MVVSKTAKIMMLSVVAVCLILLIIGLIVINLLENNLSPDNIFYANIEGSFPFAMGLLLGGVHSIIKIILIEKAINRTLDIQEKEQAANMGRLFYMGRSIITAGVLAVGAIPAIRFIGLFGTIAGILSLRFAAYITSVIESRQEPPSDNRNEDESDDENDKRNKKYKAIRKEPNKKYKIQKRG